MQTTDHPVDADMKKLGFNLSEKQGTFEKWETMDKSIQVYGRRGIDGSWMARRMLKDGRPDPLRTKGGWQYFHGRLRKFNGPLTAARAALEEWR